MLNYYYTFKKRECYYFYEYFRFLFFFSVFVSVIFRFLIKKEYVFVDFFSIVGFLLPGDYFEIFVLLLFISLKYYYILNKNRLFSFKILLFLTHLFFLLSLFLLFLFFSNPRKISINNI